VPRQDVKHSSISPEISLRSEDDHREFNIHTELTFDVACRTQHMPGWLGSTYRAMAAPLAISEELNCACIPVRPPRCVMLTNSVSLQMDSSPGLASILRCSATETGNWAGELPATIRWRYTLRYLKQYPILTSTQD
jgi:hypothetical protein